MALAVSYDNSYVDSRVMMNQAGFHTRMMFTCLGAAMLQSLTNFETRVLHKVDAMLYEIGAAVDCILAFFPRTSAKARYHVNMVWAHRQILLSRFMFVFGWSFAFQFVFQSARFAGYI